MNITERINRIITLGFYDRLTTPMSHVVVSHLVAAGNPGKYQAVSVFNYPLPSEIDYDGQIYNTRDAQTYSVSGSSMSPEDVYNGDELIVFPCNADEIQTGDYIVIEVDRKYFVHKHGVEPVFKYKLRKALVPVPAGQNDEEIETRLIDNLVPLYDELSLEEYQVELREDLRDALHFYGNVPLFASITYKEGRIHYSFHPQSAIKFRVVRIARKTRGDVELLCPVRTLN